MVEQKIEIRDAKLKIPNQETIIVKIIDMGEGLENGQPSNHDKIEIIYIDKNKDS